MTACIYNVIMFLRYTKLCMLLTLIFSITTTLLWISKTQGKYSDIEFLNLPLVVVHLDFKGMPPQLSYLKSILPNLRKLGANGLLLEYEDMFPYEGKIKNLSSEYAYTKKELSEFLKLAHSLGFEIIPLVQTFGHLEFALKLPEFLHLRENPLFSDSICPIKEESQNLIQDMLQQITEFHNKIVPLNHMHIGCDEVFNINVCENCRKLKQSQLDIFVNQVNNVYRILKSISPNVTVLIWDDMFRKIRRTGVKVISKLLDVEPVYWDYGSIMPNPHKALFYYRRKFRNTWIATAFKGADGKTKTLPNLTSRYSNNYNWLNFMFQYKDIYKFKGIILTGWSRYGHTEPPCELLPASIPSLTLNLLLVKRFKDGFEVTPTNSWISKDDFYEKYLNDNLTKELSCEIINPYPNGYAFIHQCKSDLIHLLHNYYHFQLDTLKYYFKEGIDTVDYYYNSHNIKSHNSRSYQSWALDSLLSLEEYRVALLIRLKKCYDIHFIQEYLEIKSYYLKNTLNQLNLLLRTQQSVKV